MGVRGLIEPSVAKGKGSGNERIYATDDLRVLSVIFTLRRAGVPVRTLRAVVEFMRKNSVSRWLVVSDGQVCTASRDTLSKALANPRSPVSLVLDLSGTGGPA